uniref:FRIGIDA-like protein n=1 Tax=Ananas comosus var. bracteatus TaxID=296719 RepID=A0A6V7Q3X7_ANACO|nr:unnamed protein product [Ananas comosus var. bracteatus]
MYGVLLNCSHGSHPAKKEELRKAFAALESFSSTLSFFTFKWKDLEDHFASIERSITDRLKELEARSAAAATAAASSAAPLVSAAPATASAPSAAAAAAAAAAIVTEYKGGDHFPQLKSLCAAMDAKGFLSYIFENRSDMPEIRKDLDAALLSAPDPAKLVLDALHVSDSAKSAKSDAENDGAVEPARRTCLSLLERLQVLAPEIKPLVREEAKKVAVEWKSKIAAAGGENQAVVMRFLQLLASFRLAKEFDVGEVLDLVVSMSRKKRTADIFKGLGLEESMPDFIRKMSNKGRQVEVIKFVRALNLMDKYPPVTLLKSYLKECRKEAQEIRKKGNNSLKAQNGAISKDILALKEVVKAIEEYSLESEYPSANLAKRIMQLEEQKAGKKRAAPAAAFPLSSNAQNLQQQQSNKRPRPRPLNAVPHAAAAAPSEYRPQ